MEHRQYPLARFPPEQDVDAHLLPKQMGQGDGDRQT